MVIIVISLSLGQYIGVKIFALMRALLSSPFINLFSF